LCVPALLRAQSSQQDSGNANGPASPSQQATIHGVVKNAMTGEPLPRVLVEVESEVPQGTLTDGDGRFEIPGVPVGTTTVRLTRPGFEDAGGSTVGNPLWMNAHGYPHTVAVTAEMPDLEFSLRPTNAIRGQIELSTGDPAERITVTLLRQSVLDGRQVWQIQTSTQTNADGAYRFGGLPDGVYALFTEPATENEGFAEMMPLGKGSPTVRNGYVQTFYPDARDFSGAARIRIAGGQQVQANLTLKLEPFHLVRAVVSGPGIPSAGGTRLPGGAVIAPMGLSVEFALTGMQPQVMDGQGRTLPYPAQYDASTHTEDVMLPDGDYALRMTGFRPNRPINPVSGDDRISVTLQNFLSGQTNVSVNGHAVTNLHFALAPETPSPLQVIVNRTSTKAPQQGAGNGGGVFIAVSQASAGSNALSTQFAQGVVPGTLDTSSLSPGPYWVHTTIAQPGLCEGSFTAGGAGLAREPLVMGLGGSTAPLTLTLRDDCSSLKLVLPSSALTGPGAAEEPACFVYVVPDFDSTTEVRPMRISAGSPFTMENLTPGAYHVYAFAAPVDLEYRNPEAMAALSTQGQAVTLSPGATSTLVLEVPPQ
jgi:hypothetical protein